MSPTSRGGPPRTGEYRTCDMCGGEFYATPGEDRRGSRRRFCSVTCQHESYRGAGNPKWRGGRVYSGTGYVYAHAPNHPHATDDGYVMEHRLVVERRLGRLLDPEETVHHINHVRDDNRDENLELLPTASAHRVHHGYWQEQPCAQCGEPVVRSAGHRRRWARAFCSRTCAALAASAAAAEAAHDRRVS